MSKTLGLRWTIGFNKQESGLVHNLTEDSHKTRFFFPSGNVGVVCEGQKQMLLCGHGNRIVAAAVSTDRATIATGDRIEGDPGDLSELPDDASPMIALWDSRAGKAIFRILRPHPLGVAALDLSPDGSLVVSLSAPEKGKRQMISLWKKGAPKMADQKGGTSGSSVAPLATIESPVDYELAVVRFNASDTAQVVATGAKGVVFIGWNRQTGVLRPFAPPMTGKSFKASAECVQSLFLPKATTAVTATVDGDLVLWDVTPGASSPVEKRAMKSVRLHESPLLFMATCNDRFIVTGAEDGFVRFYDFQFRLLAWLEHIGAGPVNSLSFANLPDDPYATDFLAPAFVVGTRRGIIAEVDPMIWEKRIAAGETQGTVLMTAQDGAVHGLATGPGEQVLAVVGHSGLLQLWDTEAHSLLRQARFEKLGLNSVAFTSDGNSIVLGCTNGVVKIVSTADLKEVPNSTFHSSKGCVTFIAVSEGYIATADADRCVALFRQNPADGTWCHVAKYRSHGAPITGLLLLRNDDGATRLVSLGEDRRFVEYDLKQSTSAGGLAVKSTTEIEQEAIPTAAAWLPRPGSGPGEELIVTANSHFKLRLHNAHTKSCRRTALAPLFSGPIGRIVAIPGTPAIAFAAHERIVGLIALPIDGNPRAAAGVVAHSGVVETIAASRDGRWLFSCGGADQIVCCWRIDSTSIVAASRGSASLDDDPFADMLEGGRGGPLWNEMVDYFRYAQIRAAGEQSLSEFTIGPTIPISQLPNVMRALGYFPSEREVEDLLNEVKYSRFVETNQYTEAVTFEALVRLFVNHRPVFGITKEAIDRAFRNLGAGSDGRLPWSEVALALQFKGEQMAEEELHKCLDVLTGDAPGSQVLLSHPVGAKEFAEGILGFEDYVAV